MTHARADSHGRTAAEPLMNRSPRYVATAMRLTRLLARRQKPSRRGLALF